MSDKAKRAWIPDEDVDGGQNMSATRSPMPILDMGSLSVSFTQGSCYGCHNWEGRVGAQFWQTLHRARDVRRALI